MSDSGIVSASAPDYTNLAGREGIFSLDTAGNLRVAVTGGGGGGGGSATAANQTAVQSAPGTSATTAEGIQGVTGGVPVAVSVNSIALPTGASTSALQTTGNTSLATIATNTGSPLSAGTNLIGKVGIDQTTPGTTNGVVTTGNVASAVTDSGNPVKVGGIFNSVLPVFTGGQRGDLQLDARGGLHVGLYTNSGAPIAAITATDGMTLGLGLETLTTVGVYNGATSDRLRGDINGAVNQLFAMAGSRWQYAPPTGGITNSATAVVLISAAGVGVRNYLARLQLANSTLATASEVVILDGVTVIWRGYVDMASGGIDHLFDIPLRGTANTSMSVQMVTASTTGSLYASAQGFQSAL